MGNDGERDPRHGGKRGCKSTVFAGGQVMGKGWNQPHSDQNKSLVWVRCNGKEDHHQLPWTSPGRSREKKGRKCSNYRRRIFQLNGEQGSQGRICHDPSGLDAKGADESARVQPWEENQKCPRWLEANSSLQQKTQKINSHSTRHKYTSSLIAENLLTLMKKCWKRKRWRKRNG